MTWNDSNIIWYHWNFINSNIRADKTPELRIQIHFCLIKSISFRYHLIFWISNQRSLSCLSLSLFLFLLFFGFKYLMVKFSVTVPESIRHFLPFFSSFPLPSPLHPTFSQIWFHLIFSDKFPALSSFINRHPNDLLRENVSEFLPCTAVASCSGGAGVCGQRHVTRREFPSDNPPETRTRGTRTTRKSSWQ